MVTKALFKTIFSTFDSAVAQWWSDRLLTEWLEVRVLSAELKVLMDYSLSLCIGSPPPLKLRGTNQQ